MEKRIGNEKRWLILVVAALAGLPMSATVAQAQSFNSGSTSADGALDLTGTPANTTVEFDPVARNIDPERDNIFHFTTITIPANVTLRLLAKKMPNKPVYFLATGAVNIAGILDLSGAGGASRTGAKAARVAAASGPGGFFGGQGGNADASLGGPAKDGLGPAGGLGAGNPGWSTGLVDSSWNYGRGGGSAGNNYLVPLFGGSGGGGGISTSQETWGGGGGGGGGAIVIASSVSITVSGRVYANGGGPGHGTNDWDGCVEGGGSGAGGAIRLVAPAVLGSGVVQANGSGAFDGYCPQMAAATGRVRIEAFDNSSSFNMSGTTWTKGSPVSVYLPQAQPSIAVTTIGGIPVPTSPTGEFTPPDAVINSSTPVDIQIRAHNVPVGTIVKVYVFALEGPDLTADSTPLAGSLQDSSATASLTFPAGYSRGYVRATW